MKQDIIVDKELLGETVLQLMQKGITFEARQGKWNKDKFYITLYGY